MFIFFSICIFKIHFNKNYNKNIKVHSYYLHSDVLQTNGLKYHMQVYPYQYLSYNSYPYDIIVYNIDKYLINI